LDDGFLTINLNINGNLPGPTPTSISMSGYTTPISGTRDSLITPTSPITTTDNDGNSALVSYSVIDGNLPTGLSINSGNGIIEGKPTNVGITTFKIEANGVSGSK
jgi:hypothetical protein